MFLVFNASISMVNERISTKEKVILLGAILQSSAQVISRPGGFEIIPGKGVDGAAVQLWLQCCEASQICVQRNTVRAITVYLLNREMFQRIGQDTLPGGPLCGTEIQIHVGAESKIRIERPPVNSRSLANWQSLQV
jgi:hypothetical protein